MRLMLVIGLIWSHTASAGWVGGGGSLLRDAHNPWFLENTRKVTYCVATEESFGVELTTLRAIVGETIDEWKSGLSALNPETYDPGELAPFDQIRIGTQRFVEVDCETSDEVDLRFQFGFLTSDQLNNIPNPGDYIGLAARTNYDLRNLRGRGFIYLASPQGPFSPVDARMHPDAWNQLNFFPLRTVLRHELGHVFGMIHQRDTLMDESTPEMITDEGFIDLLLERDEIHQRVVNKLSVNRFLGLKEDFDISGCGGFNPASIWLLSDDVREGWSEEDACGRVSLVDGALEIFLGLGSIDSVELVATASLGNNHSSQRYLVELWLPREQDVFTKLPDDYNIFNRLAALWRSESTTLQGNLQILNSEKIYPVLVEIGLTDGKGTIFNGEQFDLDVFHLD